MALLVYMTAASADEAERIAGDLVESRLAACVNVMALFHRGLHGGLFGFTKSFAVPKRSPSSPRRTTIVLKRWPPGCVPCTVMKPPAS